MLVDYLAQHTHDRIAAMQHEAEVYRLMIDRAPLRFGPPLPTRLRRGIARSLVSLAQRIAPRGTFAIVSLEG